jgi:hypothetical protein
MPFGVIQLTQQTADHDYAASTHLICSQITLKLQKTQQRETLKQNSEYIAIATLWLL